MQLCKPSHNFSSAMFFDSLRQLRRCNGLLVLTKALRGFKHLEAK
jgi:hypothetical protein